MEAALSAAQLRVALENLQNEYIESLAIERRDLSHFRDRVGDGLQQHVVLWTKLWQSCDTYAYGIGLMPRMISAKSKNANDFYATCIQRLFRGYKIRKNMTIQTAYTKSRPWERKRKQSFVVTSPSNSYAFPQQQSPASTASSLMRDRRSGQQQIMQPIDIGDLREGRHHADRKPEVQAEPFEPPVTNHPDIYDPSI